MQRLSKILAKTGLTLLVMVALLVSALRLTFPYLNDFRATIVEQIAKMSGQQIEIADLQGEWLAFGPALNIKDLQVHTDRLDLSVDQISLELDVWQSLLNLRWQFRELTFHQLNLDIKENNASFDIKIEPGSVGDVILRQLNYFDLKNSHISFFSPSGAPVSLAIPHLTWLNKKDRHQAEGEVSLSGITDNHGSLQVIIDLSDDKSGLLNSGMIYLQANDVNMKPWLSRWVRNNTGLKNANFNLTSWIRIANRQVEEGYLKLDNGDVSWSTADSDHYLDINNQWFHLTKQDHGWLVDSSELNIRSDGNQWPKGIVSLYWQPEDLSKQAVVDQTETLRLRATELKLEYLKPILPIFSFLDPERLAPWLDLNPQGDLLALALDIPLKQPKQLKFIANWQDVSWLPWRKLPSINHFNGYAEGNLSKGHIKIELTDSTLPYEQVFRAPLEVSQASGEFYWTNQQGLFKLWSHTVDVQARSVWINGDFGFSTSEQQGPWLSILAGINVYDGKDAWRYYPEPLMGKNLVDYLTGAIQGGQARDATLIFEGNPQQFPFLKKNGKFEVFAQLYGATLQFQPTWQPLTDLMVDLDFVDNGLWITAKDTYLANVKAPEISVSIPAYNMHTLYLDADIEGTGNHIYDYLKDSPLKDSVAAALEQVQIAGNVSGRLHLAIPLVAGKMVDASGSIRLNNNDILIKPVNIHLNKVNGSFDFTNRTLTGQKLNGSLLDQPVVVNFATEKNEHDYKINVGLDGNWSLNKLPMLPKELVDDLAAQADWQSKITITLPNKGSPQYDILLQSKLTKVSKHLSLLLAGQPNQPLSTKSGSSVKSSTKPAVQPSMQLRAKGDINAFNLSGFIGDNQINSLWQLADKQVHLRQGIWQNHAKSLPELPKQNLLQVSLPEVNGDYWLPLLATLASNHSDNKSSATSLSLPTKLLITSPAITFAGQRWQQANVQIDSQISGSEIMVNSQELSATLLTASNQPWQLSINHLYYNPFWPENKNQPIDNKDNKENINSKITTKSPRDMPINSFSYWPALAIRCDDCWFMGQRFGQIEANLQPSGSILTLTHGLLIAGGSQLSVTGAWHLGAKTASTSFKGVLSGDKVDQSMRYFGILTPLTDAPYTFNFETSWQGEPWRPQVATLSGQLSVELGRGQIANLGGGTAGNLLRLVSVTALLRKLQFDFSETFGDGFDFDSITLDSSIVNGVITTENLLIDGMAADIAMRGTVDLVQQTINMEAVVAPELSTAVGVAAAFAINPVAGVAVYAATKVLSPLWNKVSFIRYEIVGDLNNPEVNEVLRQANKEK